MSHCTAYLFMTPQLSFYSLLSLRSGLILCKMRNNTENSNRIQDCDKLNVLCLHGYRQSAESFKSKTGSFRKFCKRFANFTYIDAPHLAKPMKDGDEPSEEQKSWWFNKDDGSFKGTNQSGPAFGFEASLKVVEKIWLSGNYQGLMGFSQGSCFISVICSLSERNR